MSPDIIEFECMYGTASFAGYAYVDELYDDDNGIKFYDDMNQPQSHLDSAYFEGQEEDIEKLEIAFMEDYEFVKFLTNFAEESITIDRESYTLLINGGTQLEMNIDEVKKYSEDNVLLNAKLTFKFADTVLDNDLLDELAEDIDATWSGEGNYICKYGENVIIREVDYDWFDENYDFEQKEPVIKEMLEDAEKIFVRQKIIDKEVYTNYQDLIKQELMKNCDESYIRDAANNYEQILECYSLEEINNICEKELNEMIIEDIKRR
ncbi:hypothetical protein [Methanobrevibacter olleyae]|uniref:Uncharacterized protein n=1 Tax=Methanobrevibacter olleyae TaxID=294671 RepID=A0A126R2I5_METOL|nr:hypothetical protein [Methanobrevibacter olleyae]AMK16282.1 hypothetical protein YLM1_1727 [Methanobrevibacter olleyae]